MSHQGALLIVYGTMTASAAVWKRTAVLSSSSMTAGLILLHIKSLLMEADCAPNEVTQSFLSRRAIQSAFAIQVSLSAYIALVPSAHTSSSLSWCMWLADVLQALHFDAPSNFSSCELWTDLPSSQNTFQRVYQALLQHEDDSFKEKDLPFLGSKSPEDAIVLLIAILSDSICLRRSLGQMAMMVTPFDGIRHTYNPYLPLTPQTELDRMQRSLFRALDRWQREFHKVVSPEVMALYHYCRLYLSCPKLSSLSQMAGYKPVSPSTSSPKIGASRLAVEVFEESISHSWLVLDSTAARSQSSDSLCPPWLPIIVFHAGLVVWANLHDAETSKCNAYSSTKVLLAFKAELNGMAWPCCPEMVSTLDTLMSRPTWDATR